MKNATWHFLSGLIGMWVQSILQRGNAATSQCRAVTSQAVLAANVMGWQYSQFIIFRPLAPRIVSAFIIISLCVDCIGSKGSVTTLLSVIINSNTATELTSSLCRVPRYDRKDHQDPVSCDLPDLRRAEEGYKALYNVWPLERPECNVNRPQDSGHTQLLSKPNWTDILSTVIITIV